MKKTVCLLFLTAVCSLLLYSVSAQSQLSDRIELGREGGTTRRTTLMSRSSDIRPVEPVAEAINFKNLISISVQNLCGEAWVEVIGPKGVKQGYIEGFDMGFAVRSLSGLSARQYTIRIMLGSEVFAGIF